MLRPTRVLIALTALFLVLGAVPALADEGETPELETEEDAGHINGKFLILFAEGFDATEEDLTTLRDLGLGFGDLFKLNLFSSVLGIPIQDLIDGASTDPETGEFDFGWGELKKSLTDEELALLEELPRNFGQFVSAAKRHHGRDDHQPERIPKADRAPKDKKPHPKGGDEA